MKRLSFLALFLIISCSPSPEQIKEEIDSYYTKTKSIPASEPCKNLEGYKNLKETEEKYSTSYYSESTSQKIEKYKPLCDARIKEIEEEKRLTEGEAKRLEELKKVGDWNIEYFVDVFGDRTNRRFISQTTKGLFSNSATEDASLRAKIFIKNANLEESVNPSFKLYEYDGTTPVRGTFSTNYMTCAVKDQYGIISNIELFQSQGSDSFYISPNNELKRENIKSLIKGGYTGKFACVNDQYGFSKYVFSFNFKYFSNIVRKFHEGS